MQFKTYGTNLPQYVPRSQLLLLLHKILQHRMDRVKRIWYLSPMRAAKVQASLRIRDNLYYFAG